MKYKLEEENGENRKNNSKHKNAIIAILLSLIVAIKDE